MWRTTLEPARRRDRSGSPRRAPEVARERRQPRLVEALVDDLEQRPHRRAPPATDRRPGRRPDAAATRVRGSGGAGNGNSTFGAHAVGAAPRSRRARVDSRWVSQRSIPRVGTATTSGGERVLRAAASSVAARPSARRSARSARWTWSTSERLSQLRRSRHSSRGDSSSSVQLFCERVLNTSAAPVTLQVAEECHFDDHCD